MRRLTLQLYLGKRFLVAIFGAFLMCTMLIFIIDFVEQLRQAGKADNVPVTTLVRITLLRVPAYTEFLLPFAVLTGSIVTLLNLARKSELAVMRASGMSVWQFLQPGLVVSFLLGVFAGVVYNPMAAGARAQAEAEADAAFGRDSSVLRATSSGSTIRCMRCSSALPVWQGAGPRSRSSPGWMAIRCCAGRATSSCRRSTRS